MAVLKKVTAFFLIAALFLVPNRGAARAADETDAAAEFQAEILRLVNAEREKAGLKPLEFHEELTKAAQRRAEEAAEMFSHTRPDGARWVTVFEEYNLKYKVAGENLAKGFRTAAAMVKAWMNSDGHRANILASDYTYLGVGCFVREDRDDLRGPALLYAGQITLQNTLLSAPRRGPKFNASLQTDAGRTHLRVRPAFWRKPADARKAPAISWHGSPLCRLVPGHALRCTLHGFQTRGCPPGHSRRAAPVRDSPGGRAFGAV